ncbi:hypothetical protein SEA_JONJAMES_140 [Gordonia Phage JonJames]|nr:hypothetical protein SEA_JONJAMES_140 [Gordonia Phage JonJames]
MKSEDNFYRLKPRRIQALQWTRGMAPAVMIQFTDDLVKINDVDDEFRVYNRQYNTWVPFYYGDWIVKNLTGLDVIPDGLFSQHWEPDERAVAGSIKTVEFGSISVNKWPTQ